MNSYHNQDLLAFAASKCETVQEAKNLVQFTGGEIYPLLPDIFKADKDVFLATYQKQYNNLDDLGGIPKNLENDISVIFEMYKIAPWRAHQLPAVMVQQIELSEALMRDSGDYQRACELHQTIAWDKQFTLDNIATGKANLETIPTHFMGDKDVILAYAQKTPYSYSRLPRWAKMDKDICVAVVSEKPSLFETIVPSMRKNLDVALAALDASHNVYILNDIDTSLKVEPRVIEAAIKKDELGVAYLPETVITPDVALRAVQYHPEAYQRLNKSLQMDADILAAAVAGDPVFMQAFAERMYQYDVPLSEVIQQALDDAKAPQEQTPMSLNDLIAAAENSGTPNTHNQNERSGREENAR